MNVPQTFEDLVSYTTVRVHVLGSDILRTLHSIGYPAPDDYNSDVFNQLYIMVYIPLREVNAADYDAAKKEYESWVLSQQTG